MNSLVIQFLAFGQTLPDTGVAVEDYVNLGIVLLGSTVAVIVGGTIAFLVVKYSLRWAMMFGTTD